MSHMNTENVIHLYGTCTLLSMLSYLGVFYDNPDLNIDPEEHACDWDAFRSLQGTRVLQSVPALQYHLVQSIWLPTLQEAQEWEEERGPITGAVRR